MKKIYVLIMLLCFAAVSVEIMSQDVKLKNSFKHLLEKNEHMEISSLTAFEPNSVYIPTGILKIPEQIYEELELLDSIIGINQHGDYLSKTIYEYDSQGKKIFEATYNWEANPGDWIGNTKIEYVRGMTEENDMTVLSSHYRCDLQNNTWLPNYQLDEVLHGSTNVIKTRIQNAWDKTNEKWVPSAKWEQYYDDDNNYMTLATYDWDAVNEKWVGFRKRGNTYSEDEQYVLSETTYEWDTENEIWGGKVIIEFSAFGDVLSETSYVIDNSPGTWKGVTKTVYNDKQVITYTWNSTSANWLATTKVIAVYDSKNREIYYEGFVWNETNQIWIGERFETTKYDDGNNIIEKNVYTWNPDKKAWVQTYYLSCIYDRIDDDSWGLIQKVELTLNIDGFELIRIQMYKNQIDSDWIDSYTYKTEYVYDDDNKILQTMSYSLDKTDLSWILYRKIAYSRNDNGNLTSVITYNKDGNDWIKIKESIYYYSNIILGNNAPVYTVEIKSYPNPVKDTMTITGTEAGQLIRILSADGRLLGTYMGQDNNTQLNIASFANGVLIVQLGNERLKVLKSVN